MQMLIDELFELTILLIFAKIYSIKQLIIIISSVDIARTGSQACEYYVKLQKLQLFLAVLWKPLPKKY